MCRDEGITGKECQDGTWTVGKHEPQAVQMMLRNPENIYSDSHGDLFGRGSRPQHRSVAHQSSGSGSAGPKTASERGANSGRKK